MTQTTPVQATSQGSGFKYSGQWTYRIKPSAAIAVLVVVGAVAANLIVAQFNGVQYTEIADSAGNLLRGVTTSTGAMAIVLVIAVSYLGWWRPVWRQEPRAKSRWMWIVPLAMLVSLTLTYVSTLNESRTLTFMATLVFAAMLVGFAEELAFRGVLVVGLRERFGEGWVWFLSSLLFGLAHGGNALSGQDIPTTIMQIFSTFLLGSVLYVARMVTGTLLVPIVLHGLWDVAALSISTSDIVVAVLSQVGNLFQWIAIILSLFAVWGIAKQGRAILSARSETPQATA